MPEFKPITLADRPWVHEILYRANRPGCEYSFANLFFWMKNSGGICRFGDFLLRVFDKENRFYFFPAGQGNVTTAIEALRQDAEANGASLVLSGVTEEDRALLEQLFPGKFRFEPYRNGFDYIYPIEKLTTLAGKKLQSKRNHINRFLAEHPHYHTEPMTAHNTKNCLSLMETWYATHEASSAIRTERAALETAMEHFDTMEMDGLFLYDGDALLAFTMGNRLNERYFDVNFEKALPEVQGAYPLINREFARHIAETYPEIRFLNREDDMGLENLRKAKESYYPDLLVKYRAHWED